MAKKAEQPPMTIAEQIYLDQMIQGMSREWHKRVLKNIDPDLIVEESQRRFDEYLKKLNETLDIERKNRNVGYNLVSVWEMLKQFENVVKIPK